jgi:hypothetical protein
MGQLVMLLFHARTNAHVLHLQTRSYAMHKALNDFYDAVVPLADGLAESFQGQYGLIPEFPAKYTPHDTPDALFTALVSWFAEHRSECGAPGDTHLQNQIDEVVALVRETQYKLKFLR